MSTLYPVQVQSFSLGGAGAVVGSTSIILQSFKDINGTALVLADFGSIGYGTLEPGNGALEEQISFSGVTQNTNGTATLTGVRSVSFVTPFTSTSGLSKTHAGSTSFVISNTSGYYSNIPFKQNDETVTGQWTFTNTPIVPGTVSDASTTVKGVSKTSVAPAVANNPIVVGTNDPRVPTADPTTLFAPLSYVPAGVIFEYGGAAAPTGFLLCDGTSYLRATYLALFTAIGTAYGSVDGTHFNVPSGSGRVFIGAGTGTKVATFASRASNVITVTGLTNAANNEFQTGQAVLYSAPSGAMTGLTTNTTYYLIRTGNLTFSLATTLALAQAGTAIALSSDGTGAQTFTLTLTARTVGDTGGEENHAMSLTEALAHGHRVLSTSSGSSGVSTTIIPATSVNINGGQTNYNNVNSETKPYIESFGGNVAMNNMQPFFTGSWIIKT